MWVSTHSGVRKRFVAAPQLLYFESMKKRVLLIDESLTVQKVVALTLDKNRYAVSYAKSRAEAMHQIRTEVPDLVLVSDQVSDVTVPTFPKEVVSWVGATGAPPPVLLIAAQDVGDSMDYAGVLKKPFSPQALQGIVSEFTQVDPVQMPQATAPSSGEDLQSRFNQTFNDEAALVRETFREEIDSAEATRMDLPAPGGAPRSQSSAPVPPAPHPPQAPQHQHQQQPAAPASESAGLWESNQPGGVMGAEDSMAYKAELRNQVEDRLGSEDLERVVSEVLERLVPPIVEKLVEQRLDRLLKEEEEFVELGDG